MSDTCTSSIHAYTCLVWYTYLGRSRQLKKGERWREKTVKIKSSLRSINDIQTSRKAHDIIKPQARSSKFKTFRSESLASNHDIKT
jgi:hypothetical protein